MVKPPVFRIDGKMRYDKRGVTVTKPFCHEIECKDAYAAFTWLKEVMILEGAELVEQKIYEVNTATGTLIEQDPTAKPDKEDKPRIVGVPANMRPVTVDWWEREDRAFVKHTIEISTSCMYKEET